MYCASSLAVSALITGNMMRNENTIADFDASDLTTDSAYDPCGFVPENTRCLRSTVPFDHVAAAYATSHHFEQDFVFADFWDRHLLNANVMIVVINGGKH
jgi:hypothetical protein